MDSGHSHRMEPFGFRLDIRPYKGPAVAGSRGVGRVRRSNHHGERGDSHGRNGRNPLLDPRWAEVSVRARAPEDSLEQVVELLGGGAVF